jgi:hypothetical protein
VCFLVHAQGKVAIPKKLTNRVKEADIRYAAAEKIRAQQRLLGPGKKKLHGHVWQSVLAWANTQLRLLPKTKKLTYTNLRRLVIGQTNPARHQGAQPALSPRSLLAVAHAVDQANEAYVQAVRHGYLRVSCVIRRVFVAKLAERRR